jgi:hypothetical protein
MPTDEYAQAICPCAMAHVEKTDSAASPSTGPPIHAVTPRKTTVATTQPVTLLILGSGRSSQDFTSTRDELKLVKDID